ncbi:MAG: nucleotide exchange factor GrpE [Candidatus Adiutricales bacterium]
MGLKPPEIKEKNKKTENGNNITTESESTTLPEDQSSAEEEKISTSAAYEEKNWQEEAEKYADLYLRSTADLENVKKRLEREKDSIIKFANEDLVKNLLPVLDNIERALDHTGVDNYDQKGILEGFRLIHQSLKSVLEKFGVKPVAALSEKFDPVYHEAVMQEEDPDVEDGTVLKEVQRGYLLKNRLLRPAMVVVSKKPAIEKE